MYARDLRVGDSLPYVGQITAVRCDRETVVVKMSTFAGEQTWDGDFVVWVVRGRLW